MIYKIDKYRIIIIPLLIAFLHLQVMAGVSDADSNDGSADQDTCARILDVAEDNYFDGNLNRAVELVFQCLSQSSTDIEIKVRAYTILGRIYLVKEEPEKTKGMVKKILEINPSYQPTIEQETPRYVNLVNEVKKTWQPPVPTETAAGISSWVWIGAGTAAAAAIIIIVAGGGKDETSSGAKPLPKPPDYPE